MLPTEEVRAALWPLAGKSHLLKLSDVMETLGLRRHDCVVALDELVNAGELRQTCNDNGEPYYWFVGADAPPSACSDEQQPDSDQFAPVNAGEACTRPPAMSGS